jgi:serine protease
VSSSRTRRQARRPFFRLALLSLLAAAFVPAPARATAQPPGQHERYVPGEVIVRYHASTGQAARSNVESRTGTETGGVLPGGSRKLEIEDGESVRETVLQLRRDPHVAYAVPNYVARASALTPSDPGFRLQWNFWGPFGINMPEAWSLASRRGAPGGRGAVVAVLDTGVAYRRLGPFRRAPDLNSFVRGYDFIQNDRYPVDLNGHGTHVAGTIAAATNNGIGTAGIAYGSRIMPVRTLDASGGGDAVTITSGIRYAVRHHADVINLSLEFGPFVRASDIPDLLAAIRFARRHRVVLTGVAGNEGAGSLPYPARAKGVVAVAATTEDGCQAEYSNTGEDVDVAAPGGGGDAIPAADSWDQAQCHPGVPLRSIYQQTFTSSPARFGLPSGYYGTSMAAPHVAGLAALLIASKRLGSRPSPAAVEQRIEQTARDLGPPGFDFRYGHGLIDAAAALR